MNYQTFGWQDILVKVPNNWHMIFEKKKLKKSKIKTGYFGFRDLKEKRFELSWAKIEKKAPEYSSVLNDYVKSLKKSHKKIKIRTESPTEVNGHKARSLYWELENKKVQGYMMVWICDQTRRLLICASQFTAKVKSTEKPLIMGIISLINCHPTNGFSLWSAPNLQIYTPTSEMELIDKSFLIGLTFAHLRNDNFNLLAYRIGLADQKVGSTDEIPQWFGTYYKENLPGIPSAYNPPKFKKYIYKKKTITWRSIQRPKKRLLSRSLKNYDTYLWINQEKNDIYCIIFSIKQKPSTKTRNLFKKMIKLAINSN